MIHKDRISDFSRFLITGLTALLKCILFVFTHVYLVLLYQHIYLCFPVTRLSLNTYLGNSCMNIRRIVYTYYSHAYTATPYTSGESIEKML